MVTALAKSRVAMKYQTLIFAVMGALGLTRIAGAQEIIESAFKEFPRENTAGSLAILRLAGILDNSANAISLQSNMDNRDYDFESVHIGGGFRLSLGVTIYLEGYIGCAKHDPVLFLFSCGRNNDITS
ncbi:hypothetical protein [Ruegeria arenilitoris]|uniref:hypothetical protein n=1 Tax=Ruegeria arenilitoris TaxID=1173585 RepID=UPI0020C44F54|nr:hypothetical protein [Ruegeria arenilitoris]